MSRQANGLSSVYQGADGRWHGRVSMGVRDDGTPDRRHVSAKTEAETRRKVRALEKQRDAGQVATAGRKLTVGDWLTYWLENVAAPKVAPSTYDGYETYIRNRLVPGLGAHRLDRLLPEHVEKFYRASTEDGMRPASVLQMHRILSRALKVAMQRGRVARNVCTLVDAPSLQRDEVEPLTQAEARQILAAAEGRRNAARWSVALALGMRQGEALGLGWDQVDLTTGTIRVREQLQRRRWKHGCDESCGDKPAAKCPQRHGGGLVKRPPKSRAGRRTIMMPAELAEAMRRHYAAQHVERETAGNLWNENGLVFAQMNGRPIDPRADWGEWTALLKAAGVRHARLHDARHTAASLLLAAGVPARMVMELLGHSQISLTLGTYSHVVPELADEAAKRMSAALWGSD